MKVCEDDFALAAIVVFALLCMAFAAGLAQLYDRPIYTNSTTKEVLP